MINSSFFYVRYEMDSIYICIFSGSLFTLKLQYIQCLLGRAVKGIIWICLYPYPYSQLSDSDTDNIRFISDMDNIRFFSNTNADISDGCRIFLMVLPY